MNELYGFDSTSPGMLPPFAIQSEENRAMARHCSTGIEPRISVERIILLDTQPVFSAFVLAEMMKPDGSSTISVLNGESLSAELAHELMGIQEKIDNHVSQCIEASSEISPNDPVGSIFGEEHPGRVRGLGLGAVSTIAFKRTTTRLHGMNFGSSSGSTSSINLEQTVVNLASQVQALTAYITAKDGGRIPEELAALFPNFTQQASDIGSGASSLDNIRRSSGGSNPHAPDHQNPPNST